MTKKKNKETVGLYSIAESVRITPDKIHGLKSHFRGCLRQVIATLDLLARNDPERFVYCSPQHLIKHATKFTQGKPVGTYSLRQVRYSLKAAIKSGIVQEADRKRDGTKRHGWIVADHNTICRVEGSHCLLTSATEERVHPSIDNENVGVHQGVHQRVHQGVHQKGGMSAPESALEIELECTKTGESEQASECTENDEEILSDSIHWQIGIASQSSQPSAPKTPSQISSNPDNPVESRESRESRESSQSKKETGRTDFSTSTGKGKELSPVCKVDAPEDTVEDWIATIAQRLSELAGKPVHLNGEVTNPLRQHGAEVVSRALERLAEDTNWDLIINPAAFLRSRLPGYIDDVQHEIQDEVQAIEDARLKQEVDDAWCAEFDRAKGDIKSDEQFQTYLKEHPFPTQRPFISDGYLYPIESRANRRVREFPLKWRDERVDEVDGVSVIKQPRPVSTGPPTDASLFFVNRYTGNRLALTIYSFDVNGHGLPVF